MEGQKGGGRTTTTIEDLGDDVMVEILRRSLPLRSIISCLVVCKRWRTLISCSALLLTKSINVVATFYRDFVSYACIERGQRGGRQKIFSGPPLSIYFPKRDSDGRILVSCNGLFFSCYYFLLNLGPWLRSNDLVNQCFISNPWTKEFVRIPGPTKPCKFSLCGLAFENNSSQKLALYKIVMAPRIYTYEKDAPYKFEMYSSKFEMYSSDKKKWQWLPEAPRPKHHSYCKSDQIAVYCNRVLYWQCRWKKKHALMFNVETESFGHLDLPGADDSDDDYDDGKEEWRAIRSRLAECKGQLHFIRIGSTYGRLIIWKITMSGGWLILHNVDLRGAVESNLNLFPNYGPKRRRAVAFSGWLGITSTMAMSCEGDDKVLLEDTYSRKRIVSYDLNKGVFELVYKYDWHSSWKFFRYTPTTKFISER